MNISQQVIEYERARCESYKLLAACFYQPQADTFQDGLLQNLEETLKNICPDAAVYAVEMIKMFSLYSEEELLIDYAKLFVGPNELLAPPYGSIYLDKERRVMGDSTMAVVDFYASQGLVIDSDFKELPDHIAAELEFMYYLVFKEIQALESSDLTAASVAIEAQDVFMNKFLRPWADEFAKKIEEGSETGFYKALAGCLSAFIYKTDIYGSLS